MTNQQSVPVQVYLTNADRTALVSPQSPSLSLVRSAVKASGEPAIVIHDDQPRQSVEGFGYTLTQGSAEMLLAMSPNARHQLLQELFGTGEGQLGISTLRLPIGTTDLADELYTLDDVPVWKTDPQLQHFSMARDEAALIPLCREILAVHPGIHLMASPWTAPLWMKESLPGKRFLPFRTRGFAVAICETLFPPLAVFLLFALLVLVARHRMRTRVAALYLLGVLCAGVILTLPPKALGRGFLQALDSGGGHVAGDAMGLLRDGKVWSLGRWHPLYYSAYLRLLAENQRVFPARVFSDVVSMVTNGRTWRAGRLRQGDYDAYARYFLRYLQAMQQDGVPVEAVTIQNESEPNLNKPSMGWTAAEQNRFVRDFLGPTLRHAGLQTRILTYDHNADHPQFPLLLLNDPRTNAYVDGSAFHLYAGKMDALSQVHERFPQKNIYFTEQMVIEDTRSGVMWPAAEPVQRIFVGALRNWSRDVILWNLAADANAEPHVLDGGCPTCLGALTLQGDHVTRNLGYHVLAQVARFVPEGSTVLASTDTLGQQLGNVALRTPDGRLVLVVTNLGAERSFTVKLRDKSFTTTLAHNSVATYTWHDQG